MEEDVVANVGEFVTMISAGLAGSSPHMISATITSLSRLVYEFHSQSSSSLRFIAVTDFDFRR